MEKILSAIDTYYRVYHEQKNEEQAYEHFENSLLSFIFENFPLINVEANDIFYRVLIIADADGRRNFRVKAFFNKTFDEKMQIFYPEYCI